MAISQGQFVWYELMTSDTQAAAAFYREVVGWSSKDSESPDQPYTIFSAGPTMIGGLMAIPEDARAAGLRPGWIGYIGVDDVDDYVTRVIAQGGKLHRNAQDIPGIGRFAVVADPHGAAFVLFHGIGEPPAARAEPAPAGTIGWHELHASDGASAFAFYSGLFGWTKADALDMGSMGVYQIFAIGGVPTGGMMTKAPETPAPFWLYYVNVDAINAAMARVNAAGGKVVMGPQQVPGGMWIVQGRDPQGAMFALVSANP